MLRFFSSSLSLFTLVALVGCTSKPNPRLSRVVEKPTEGENRTTEFTYDGAGRIEKILRTEGEDEKEWEFVWEGSELVQVNTSNLVAGNEREDDEFELTWEGNRLVKAERNGDRPDQTVTLDYNTDGQLDDLRAETDGGEDQRTKFDYDENGALVEITAGDQVIDLDRDDNRLTGLDSTGSAEFSFDFEFDDEEDRIDSYVLNFGEVKSTVTVSYDSEGRVSDLESEFENNGETFDGQEVEFEYDEGNAVGLDVTTIQFFSLPFLVDMKGGTYESMDNRLTVPRLIFDNF
jgi:YD repeat-containing protein